MNRAEKRRGCYFSLQLFYAASGIALLLCLSKAPLVAMEAAEATGGQKSAISPVAKPHKELPCEDCHAAHSANLLDETCQSCLKCHEDAIGKNSHPTNIPYKGQVPEGLPLSKEGKITCYTCHVLHETESPVAGLLRKKFDALCMTCHFAHEK